MDSDADSERYVGEPAKDPGWRSPYQRDRARVLHSAAFRRLAAKTQVQTLLPLPAARPASPLPAAGSSSPLPAAGRASPLPAAGPSSPLPAAGPVSALAATIAGDDFPRTRLTHSIEVAQIAREMGERLGCDPDIVDTAGLAHDLGHPPFGHNGEAALDAVAAACGGFEGNAQTLRVLTRLEAKIPGAGLNLTRGCLDAVSKYPWPRQPGQRKYGVYPDDAPVFAWLRDGVPDRRRCLEAQVMDWADDVAYSVHDVEDGIHGGHIDLAALHDPDERAALCADVAGEYSDETPADLATVLDELRADPVLAALTAYDGSHPAQIALKRATSVYTGRFVAAAVRATRARHGDGPLSRYAADLVVPRETRARCALLKGLALRYVMRRPGAESQRTHQRELLTDLVALLTRRAPDSLDPVFAPLWKSAPDDPARLRVVIDQVASLTDPTAVAWHHRETTHPA